MAKHARSTPDNVVQFRKHADGAVRNRRAALASILTLSTVAGASAIVLGAELVPKAAASQPSGPDAPIHAFVADALPAFQECHVLSTRMNELREAGFAEVGMTPDGRDDALARDGHLPELEAAFAKHGYREAVAAWRLSEEGVAKLAAQLAPMQPKTLPGLIAKAKLAQYQPYIALYIIRDLLVLDAMRSA